MTRASVHSTAAEIPLDECLRLLATMSVGRVAVAREGEAPVVVPVNYALDDDVVVFRADRGSRLDKLDGVRVSFEVDLIDPFQKLGWSILVRGTARQATAEQAGHVEVEAWVATRDMHWIRISPDTITGRRIQLPPIAESSAGYL